MGKPANIHDSFIRGIMADRAVARDYFQNCLPPFVSERLDFSTLVQLPDSYVSKELQNTISDILYSCQMRDGKGEVKVSLLVEHKSSPYKYTPVQLGSYIFSGLLRQLDNKEELTLVIPVLLYHGREKWEYRVLSGLFRDMEPEWTKFVPNFDFVYHDLGGMSDSEVEALNNRFLAASLLALKHGFEKSWLESNALRMLLLAGDEGENLQSRLIVYIFERSGLKEERIIEIVETLPKHIKTTVMSTLDIFVEKGKKIGFEKGIEEGLQKGIEEGLQKGRQESVEKVVRNLLRISHLSDEQIAAAAEVTPEYVAHIREQSQG